MKELRNKILTMALCLTFVFCPMMAQADMVWEPENSFWESHKEDCKYLGRRYQAAGKVEVYKSPEDSKAVEVLNDGDQLWSYWIYKDQDGNEWIFCEHGEGGWIPKASLEIIYDDISFENEFADQIREEDGSLDEQYFESTVYFWNYPGALEEIRINMKDFDCTWLPEYEKVFTDEYGHEWGFINYWYGHKNKWVCIDKPTFGLNALYDGNIPERGVKIDGENPVVVEKLIDPAEVEKVVPVEDGSNLLVNSVVIFCVLGVIIITVAILRTMKKKNGKEG